MQESQIPTKIDIVWASQAGTPYVRAIPDTIQQPASPFAASFPAGFPPNTFLAPAAGGEGPDGRDMNGILQQLSAWSRWQAAGGPIIYDATFQTAIGGYPNRAVVASLTTPGAIWVSTADNNTTNPDTGGAGWVDFFAPVFVSVATITTSGNFTVPVGVFQLKATAIGAGGAGAGTLATSAGQVAIACGGNGGCITTGIINVTPGQVMAVVIGAGGVWASGNGGSGGTTTIGGLTAPGGTGAGASLAGAPPPSVQAPPLLTRFAGGGYLNTSEQSASVAIAGGPNNFCSGRGGDCGIYGAGGNLVVSATQNGNIGLGYGSGGSGGAALASSGATQGGPGAPGVVFIEY